MNVIIGLQKVYYAIMTDEVEETYGEVKELGKGIEIGVTATENTKSLAAGDGAVLTEQRLGNIDLTFTIPSMSTEAKLEIFGLEEAEEGGIIYNSNAVKPYVAIMFEKTLNSGNKEYVTLFKGKLQLNEDKAKSADENGNFEYQTVQFSGKFIPLKDGNWQFITRSTDKNFDAETWATKWGTQVIKPTKKVSLPPQE